MQSTNNLRKRLYQNLLNKEPKQNHLLGSLTHSKSAILKPKVVQQAMNTTAKMTSPVFQKGKLKMQTLMKSPQIPKKIAPIEVKDKLTKQGKAIIQQGKLKSKTNLKPHDIFAFYEAFPQMSEDFFYLNRIGHPYDYQIVTYSQRNPLEYMTISFKGVTLYHEKQAEFMTKQQWLADEKIYYSLQRIEFFKQYKISKNFTIWKNRMRRHYMKQMSNLLNESLFLSFEHPRHCLLQVRKVTNYLKESTYFLPSNSIQSQEPEQYKKNGQNYIQNQFMSKVKQIQNMVIEQLQIAISEQIKKFKIQNNIKINDVGDHDQKQHKQGYVYSQQAILRKQYKKVNKLIKLADNIILQSKIQLFHQCLNQLIDKIQEVKSNDSKSQWIKCTAKLIGIQDNNKMIQSNNKFIQSNNKCIQSNNKFIQSNNKLMQVNNNRLIQDNNNRLIQGNNRIQWNPTLQGLKLIFKQLINLTIVKMSDQHQKISSRQKFQKFKSNQQNDNRKDQKRNTLKYMIEDSTFYHPLIKKIQYYLQEQFKKTQKQEKQLIKFIDIYTKHKQLPDIKEIFKTHLASAYIQLVRDWRQDDADMHLLPVNKSGGLLVFDYSLLRSTMHQIPKKTLTSFLAQLPQQTKKKYNQLVDQSQNHLQHINNYPINMQQFVQFNKSVKKATGALDDLIDGSKTLIQMAALIQQNKSQNHDINKINPKKAIQNINKLKAKVDQSNAKYDQSLSKLKKQLQSRISRVKTTVKQLASKFQVIPFDNISSQIIPTIQKLQQIFPSIQKLQQQAQNIQQIQWQLSLPSTQMNQVHDLYKKSIDIKNLWQCKQKWNQLLLQIYHRHYKYIDCKQLKGKWQAFAKKNTQLQKSLADNQVLRKLIGEVSQFQNLLETISALTSPNLQDKSWRQISQYLAYQLNIDDDKKLPFSNKDDPQYTVQWLINNNISLYKQKISFIVQKSQKQKQLQTNLGQFKNFISSIVFDTIVKKRQVSLIEKNITLQNNLKDKISILYSLIGNQYSQTLKNEAQVMIKHYQYMQQILQGMYTFRQQWQKYQPFFQTNAVSTKLLTKQSKQFSSWEMQWKKIIKNITNDPAYFYRKICDQTMGVNCSRAIIKSMNKANMFLDLVKKGIQQFLQKKRLQFPRYCLFTDQQLLSILSKLDSRHLIVPQIIPILYDNIKSIQYDQQNGYVVSVTSNDNTKFILIKQSAFKLQSQMEDLLKITQDQIKKSMAQSIRTAFNKYIQEDTTRQSLLKDNNLQVALLVDYISWIRLAEQTYIINQPIGNMQDWLNIQQQQIKQVSTLMKNISPDQYFKYLQFMVQSIYFRQKTFQLKKNNIADTTFYQWQRIPKMIMTNSQIHLRQLQSKVSYNYELLNQRDVVVIQAQTQKVWINLINAIAGKQGKNVIGLNGNNIQAIKDLSFYVGQTLKSLKFSDSCNVKTVQRLLTGYMYIGCWIHFMPINNLEILSYIAYHINSLKRASNFESTSSALQLTKSTMLNNSFSNAVFLFQSGQQLVKFNLIDTKNFRNVTLHKPDQQYIISIICQAQEIPKQIGSTLVNLCEVCRDTFSFGKTITHEYQRNILQQIKNNILPKFSQNQLNNPQTLDFIVICAIQQNLSIYFTEQDIQLFQSFKISFISNYLILRSRFNYRFSKNNQNKDHIINKYINEFPKQNFFTQQFINQAIRIYDMLINNNKLGVIVSGQILGGKSEVIAFIQKVRRFQKKLNNCNQRFQVLKLYPNAYKLSDILKANSQQKKQKKQKSDKSQKSQKQKVQKVNEQLGIIQSYLKQQAVQKWLILDGKIDKQLQQFTRDQFDSIIVPNYGIISKQKYEKQNLQKIKFIIQTSNLSQFSPSLFYNYSSCHLVQSTITVQSLVKSFLLKQQIKKYLKSLTQQSISYIENQLIYYLTRVEQKGNIKSKALEFLYPFSDNQITIKSLKIIQCVFKLNQQSIRQKQKNMKKTIEKFVIWSILIVLYLHVQVENQSKLQKKFLEICKCQNIFNQSIIKYIVYPSSGIEVHPVNGLRTQSSLFQIPQRGIITLTAKNDFNDFNNFLNQKNSKFYQQINLQTTSLIRVNHDESNLFNYYSQLFSYANQPIVLTGPMGTGKKSILELYAKNIRHKSFVHSIRYNHRRSLMETYQKLFRKYNSLNGVILKSVSVTKNVVVFVEDLNLVREENQSLQFLRMLANDNMFINKNGQVRKLTQQNNSLCILSNRMNMNQNVLRLAGRLMFFQTSVNTTQKLASIFLPYMKAWSKANNLEGEVQRIFSSSNGDTLLDATIKVMQSMQDSFKLKKTQQNYSLDTILLRPRIGDITKVLSCICLTQDANRLPISYYSELWANQIMRVFDDRLSPAQKDISKALMELIKKEFFLKFKQNFQYNAKQLFIFSSYLSGDTRFYERIYDLQHLQQMIQNAYESQTITVPVKLFFNQLIKQILKIYRILQISNGHMVLFHLNKKVRQYMIELASQIAQTPFIQLKQSLLTVQKDILGILEYESDVSLFEDIDDITQDQIYQFTCLLNKNYYDYDMKAQTREKAKNKVSKYLKQMLNDMGTMRQNTSLSQKLKYDGIKQKQNIYLNQKLEDEIQNTMQQIMMNSVHFMFGASPINKKTRKFLLNQNDLVGQMHFSFFEIPQESLIQISKQILSIEEQSDNISSSSSVVVDSQQTKKQRQQASQRILAKCMNIYNSLSLNQQDYNALLCICENTISEKQRLRVQSRNRIQQLQKSIQNYKKSLQLITDYDTKLKASQNQLQYIKKEQFNLSQQLEEKGNQINDLQLNVTQNTQANQQQQAKKQLLQQKNQQFQRIEDQLRQIKMKKDKNDIQTRQARKIIQLSKDFIQIVQNVTLIQQKLIQQKVIESNIQSLLALWWSLIFFASNKNTQDIIINLNKWMNLIEFKQIQKLTTPDDVILTFNPVISRVSTGMSTWDSISPQNRLKGIILVYKLMHHQQTTSANRILTLYDPCKIYEAMFSSIPLDSQVGNYSLVRVIDKYNEDFWTQTQKYRKGLIFLDETIQSRQKKQIQSHMIKRRLFQLNRFVSLVNKRQKADLSFIFEKKHFVNYLKIVCLKTYEPARAAQLKNIQDEYIRQSKKLREMNISFKSKRADMKFDMQSDTQQLNRLKRDIKQVERKLIGYKQKIQLSEIRVKDESIIIKIVDEIFRGYESSMQQGWKNQHVTMLPVLQRLYKLVKQKMMRFISELRQSLETSPIDRKINEQQNQQLLQSNKQIQQNQQIQQKKSIGQLVPQYNRQEVQYTQQQQQLINEYIQLVLKNNLSLSQQVQSDDLFSLNLLSLQLQQKIPIVIVQNNLINYSLINRQNRPINLLYNQLSNVLVQSLNPNSQDKFAIINHKILLFYNDHVHFNVLIDLVNKYIDQFKLSKNQNKIQKKHCIYLFTNSSIHHLINNQNQSTSNYKLFFYQRNQSYNSNKLYSNKLNDKSTKTQIYIKTLQYLTKSKFYNNLSQVQKYSEYLLSKNSNQLSSTQQSHSKLQLKKYLTDISSSIPNQQDLIDKIFTQQIKTDQLNKFISSQIYQQEEHQNQFNNYQQTHLILQKIQNKHLQITQNFNKMIFDQIQDQLPYLFNTSDLLSPATKDSLCYQIQQLAKTYNKKLKKIKHLLTQNLKQYHLLLNKLPFRGQQIYLVPTPSYMRELNKEYKTIKKLLSLNGMLIGPSPSMNKIVSSKGINMGVNSESNLLVKNCMGLQDLFFNKKILNQLKIRASRKLKIPFNRIGIMWVLERKSQNFVYPPMIQKVLNNTSLDIILSVSGTLINGELKSTNPILKQQKDSSKLLSMRKNISNKSLRLLIIPYDMNTYTQAMNSNNLTMMLGQATMMGLKKKTIIGQSTFRKDQNNKQKNMNELIKIKIVCQQNNETQQELGVVQMYTNEISGQNMPILNPKILISSLKY